MEKINITELLKDCPKGMELDCSIHTRPVIFNCVKIESDYPIRISSKDGFSHSLTYWGSLYNCEDAKCVIFPKGKNTWEGFTPPYEFKNGDVIVKNNFIAIISHIEPSGRIWYHCWYNTKYEECKIKTDFGIGCINDDDEIHFATKEEKEKLFKVIEDNGYKWNEKINTFEKLIKPIFKKGDKVRVKNGVSEPRIIDEVCDRFYTLIPIGSIHFIDQHNWELVPNKIEPKFKVGDKITNGKASITIGYIDDEYYYEIGRDVAHRLFIKDQDEWNLVPDKFNINTLKPFESKVLVRDSDTGVWRVSFWGCLLYNQPGYIYDTIRGSYKQCIPYENNEYLLGKTEDCKDFYKTW